MSSRFTTDTETIHAMLEELEQQIAVAETPVVQIRCAGKPGMDFATVTAMVRLMDRADRAGGHCELLDASDPLRRSLQAAGLHRLARFGFSA